MKIAVINLSFLAASSSAWSVVYHSGSGCRGDIIAHSNLPNVTQPESVCHVLGDNPETDPSTAVRSARIVGLDEELDFGRHGSNTRYTVRFYSNDVCFNTCSNRNVLGQMDWDDCISFFGRYRHSQGKKGDTASIPLKDISFNMVEAGRLGSLTDRGSMENNAVLSDGFCMLSHGAEIAIHGRKYRMQQVAASWFRDIPAEDWDDAVHTKSTDNRFAQHGDVDALGEMKMWQEYADYATSIPLQQWNDTLHVKAEKGDQANDDLMWSLHSYCNDVEMNNTAVLEDMASKIPSLNVVKVCEEVKIRMQETEDEAMRIIEKDDDEYVDELLVKQIKH